ncbi:MAG TPA: PhzF family phenazine biosynthesis protein [Xanthobacteraceae bacterium]|nr:PhzF family phenazine biosynthesis protein [Xanthobacteraceae bacterium]
MRLPIYQVDAFTDRLFGGNPAAVCPLQAWLPDKTMQAIATENNLAETAFFVREGSDYALRWFTPTVEVDLCGHATLASGHIVFNFLEPGREGVRFHTAKAGVLTVSKRGDLLVMDLPVRPATPVEAPAGLVAALGGKPREVLRARDHLIVYGSAAEVAALNPDLAGLAKLDCWAAIVTAPGEGGIDFVSRFFAPAQGIPEDPVTGSAHCTLVPYWAQRLGKTEFEARQLSRRGGALHCALQGERVSIGGRAVLYLEGQIEV